MELNLDPQIIADTVKSPEFKGEPAYALLIHANDPHLRKGDNFDSVIEISGAGDVSHAKITISLPEYIIDGNIIFTQRIDSRNPQTITALSPPLFIDLPIILFTNALYTINPANGQASLCNVGERYNEDNGLKRPLLSFSFKIADDAPEGDHKIFLNLSYKSKGGIWQVDKQSITIHINHWYENEKIKYLIILPIIPILFSILDYIDPNNTFFSSDTISVELVRIFIIATLITTILFYEIG